MTGFLVGILFGLFTNRLSHGRGSMWNKYSIMSIILFGLLGATVEFLGNLLQSGFNHLIELI